MFSRHIHTCPHTSGLLWQVWYLSHAGHRRWMWEKEVTSTPRAPLTPLSPIPHGPNHALGSPQGNAREFPLWAHAEVRNRNNARTSGNYPLLYIFTSSSVFPHCLFLRAVLGAIVFTVLYLQVPKTDMWSAGHQYNNVIFLFIEPYGRALLMWSYFDRVYKQDAVGFKWKRLVSLVCLVDFSGARMDIMSALELRAHI